MAGHPPRHRLLLLLPYAPRLDAASGGKRVVGQLLATLAPRHEVAVLYLRGLDEAPICDVLREQCALIEEVVRPQPDLRRSRLIVRHMRLVAGLLRGQPEWCFWWNVPAYRVRARALAQQWQPDIIQFEFHVMAQYVDALKDCPAPRVLTMHEPGLLAARERVRAAGQCASLLARLDAWAWQRFEQKALQQVQAVVVFTEQDLHTLVPLAGQTPIVQIPFGVPVPQQALDPRGSMPPRLLFVGSFSHAPNVDAAARLAQTMFPMLQQQFPDLTLYLVGANPPPQLQGLANERVVVTGYVPDVTPYLDHAAVVVVPLRRGGGMRVKVAEALAAGKAVVASPLAAAGLSVRDGEQLVLAETDEQFVAAAARLLAEPEQRTALAGRARAWATKHLDWSSRAAAYEALYEQLLGQRPVSAHEDNSLYLRQI